MAKFSIPRISRGVRYESPRRVDKLGDVAPRPDLDAESQKASLGQRGAWLRRYFSDAFVDSTRESNAGAGSGSSLVATLKDQASRMLDVLRKWTQYLNPTSPLDSSSAVPATSSISGTTAPISSVSGMNTGAVGQLTDRSNLTGWERFVLGKSSSGNYAGVPPLTGTLGEIPAGYQPGQYRGQLEGFNSAKFDPAHPEGMTLKMVAARVFEQIDVYSPTAVDDAVAIFRKLGIPAEKVGTYGDRIDFHNGEGPIDVIRNAEYLSGDKSKGMAWQWAPEGGAQYVPTQYVDGLGLIGLAIDKAQRNSRELAEQFRALIASDIRTAYGREATDEDYDYWLPKLEGGCDSDLVTSGQMSSTEYWHRRMLGWQAGGYDLATSGPYAGSSEARGPVPAATDIIGETPF